MLDFNKMFDDYAKSIEKEWAHDRSKSVGASEVFACWRQVFFKKRGNELGFDPDPDYVQRWGATARGNLIENYHVVPAIMNNIPAGVEAKLMGDEQETLHVGRNSATPDGLLCNLPKDALKKYGVDDIKSTRVMFEIKSIDSRASLKTEKRIHRGQAITQMGVIRELTEREEDKPNYCVILYVDASFYDVMTVFVVEYDAKVWESAKARANRLWTTNDPSVFPPEGKFEGECDYCAFKHECAKVTQDGIPEGQLKNDPIDELDDYIKQYADAAVRANKAEKEKKVIGQTIKELLTERDIKAYKNDDAGSSVSWSFVSGRQVFDKDAAIADGVDIDKYMKRGAGFDRLLVKSK